MKTNHLIFVALLTLACTFSTVAQLQPLVPTAIASPVPSPVVQTPGGARVVIFATDTYVRSCADLDCGVVTVLCAGTVQGASCSGGWCKVDAGWFCLSAARGGTEGCE